MKRNTFLNVRAACVLGALFFVFGGTGWSFEAPTLSESAVSMTRGEYETLAQDFAKAYVTPLNVPGSAFRSDGVNPDQLLTWTHYDEIHGMNVENAFAVAPVYLPDGATVSMVGAQVFDGVGTVGACGDDPAERDVVVYLFRVDNFSGEVSQMAVFSTTGSDPDYQYFIDLSVDFPLVEYPAYSYFAATRLCHSAQAFCVMQIFYTVD